MNITPAQAIAQSEQLILEFCQELPDEELVEIEKVNFEKIKALMSEVGHASFADAIAQDIEPPSMYDLHFYARFGNKEVEPLLLAGLESDDADDVEDAIIGLCFLELEEGLVQLRLAIEENKLLENNADYLEMLFEEVLDEVSEAYKDKLIKVLDTTLEEE